MRRHGSLSLRYDWVGSVRMRQEMEGERGFSWAVGQTQPQRFRRYRGNGLKKCRFMFALTSSHSQLAPKGTFLGTLPQQGEWCALPFGSQHSTNHFSPQYFQLCSNFWLNFHDCVPSTRHRRELLPYKQWFQPLPETPDKFIPYKSEPSAIMRSKTTGRGDTYNLS